MGLIREARATWLTLYGLQRRRPAFVHLLVVVGVGAGLGAATAVLPRFLAVALVVAAIAAWWIAPRPEFGLLLILGITGGLVNYDVLPYLNLGPISFHVTDLLLLYLLGLVAIQLLVRRDFPFVSTGLDTPLLLFFGAALISVVTAIGQFGVNANIAVREFRIVAYWLGFFAVTQLIRTQRQLHRLVGGLVVLSILMTGVVLLQMAIPSLPLVRVSSETLVTAGQEFKGVSRVWITGERIIYVMLIVAVCLFVFVQSMRLRRIFAGLTVVLFLWLFLSFQRNYWLTTALSLGILGFLLDWPQRLRLLRWAVLGLAILAFVFAIPGSPLASWGNAALDRVLSLQQGTLERDMSAILREAELQFALRKVAEYPVFGVGIGNAYRPWIQLFDYFPNALTADSRGLTWYCHNAYVWIWVKMGTLGLGPFLWLCFAFLYRGFRNWRRIPDVTWRAIVLGFTLAFVGQMVSNLVAPNFIQSWVLIIYPVMMGINELVFKWSNADKAPR